MSYQNCQIRLTVWLSSLPSMYEALSFIPSTKKTPTKVYLLSQLHLEPRFERAQQFHQSSLAHSELPRKRYIAISQPFRSLGRAGCVMA